MTPITIERPILINSLRIQSYDSAARSRLIQEQEAQIKAIEALEFKTQETKDEIAAARENLVEVIRLFDEDYAARKETAKD